MLRLSLSFKAYNRRTPNSNYFALPYCVIIQANQQTALNDLPTHHRIIGGFNVPDKHSTISRIPDGITNPSKLGKLLGVSRQRAHQILNRKAHNARVALNDALQKGKVVKPDSCVRCTKETIDLEAHHPDYNKALDVRWLCPPCHAIEHPHHPTANKTGEQYTCLRCGHTWRPLKARTPRICPSCNSPYWQTATRNGTAKPCQCASCIGRTEGEQ